MGTSSWFCNLLAEVSAHLGYTADGLQALAAAHTLAEQHEERWWEAEVHRLHGILFLQQPETPPSGGEEVFTGIRIPNNVVGQM